MLAMKSCDGIAAGCIVQSSLARDQYKLVTQMCCS